MPSLGASWACPEEETLTIRIVPGREVVAVESRVGRRRWVRRKWER
jgi:hypothetical protein